MGDAGAVMGAPGGTLSDLGIDGGFVRAFAEALRARTPALFVPVAKATTDKVVAEIRDFRPRVLKTSLSSEQEEGLREALAASAP